MRKKIYKFKKLQTKRKGKGKKEKKRKKQKQKQVPLGIELGTFCRPGHFATKYAT